MLGSIPRNFTGTLVAAAIVAVGVVAWKMYDSVQQTQQVRDQLNALSADYEDLRQTYDEAVRRTAITELLVTNGKLCVLIRTIDGRQRVIDTPYDPSREIYVDYVVVNGRLWIRRVFDDQTPPKEATLIDPTYAAVDWSQVEADHGKAAYRSLSEGRWIVTATGDGSLGLRPAGRSDQVTLSEPPVIREFQPTTPSGG